MGRSRVRVADIVQMYRLPEYGESAEAIQEGLPHLTLRQVKLALAYWRKHPAEIEQEIREEEDFITAQYSKG